MAIAKAAAGELKTQPEELPARVAALLDERKKLERDLTEARKKLAMGGGCRAASSGDATTSRQSTASK